VSFKKDWEVVRQVSEAGGEKFNRAGYEKESKREEEARAKATAAKK
jgi:phosphonate transport system substrate-binding protein